MTATTKFLMQISRPRRPRRPRCRICGCTDHNACVTDVDREGFDRGHCYWIGESREICSRCFSADQPTSRQIHELQRIIDRHKTVSVLYANGRHELEVLVGDRPNIVYLAP